MELNFLYNDGAHLKKISFNATEITDQTFLMSQVGGFREGTKNVGWCPKINNATFRSTEPRYFGTTRYQSQLMGPGITGDYSRFFPNELVTAINKFPAENTYTLTTSSNFLGTKPSGSQYYTGVPLLREVDGAYKKVCNLLWAYNDQPIPGQSIHAYYNTGFWGFSYPSDEFPNAVMYSPTRNEVQFQGELPEQKMSLWIITVQDDVTGSVSYGREFKLLVQVTYVGSGFANYVSFIDLRLLNGTDDQGQPIPNAADPKKNSTPNGWGGARNTASSADTPGVAPTALKYSVNWGAGGGHGIFLYRISIDNLVAFSQALWSDNFIEKFKNSKFSPASCVLAVMRLPYVAEIDTLAGGAGGQPVSVVCGGQTMQEITTKWIPSASGHPAMLVTGKDVLARYALGGQEQQSNEVSIEQFFNSFLDFEPYTQIHIRIPFVGMVQIPTSAVMGGKLKLNWIFDNRNGNFVCQILTKSMRNMQYTDADGWVILAQYTGCCSMPMALCANDGGGMAQMASITGFASSAVAGGVSIATGNVASGATTIATGAIKALGDAIMAPHQTQLVGTVHAEASIMEDLTVRVLITRPVDVTPGEYQSIDGQSVFVGDTLLKQKGLAAYSGAKVKDYEGMTAGYILGNIEGATADEMAAIRNAFLGGVIV